MTDEPMEINGSPLPDQLWAAVRQIAPAVMAFALGKGWLDNDSAVLLGVVGGIVWPIVAGQLKTRKRACQLATLERHVADNVAVRK